MMKLIGNKPVSEWDLNCSKKLLIAGPCSAESPEQLLSTAMALKKSGIHVLRAGIWKPRTRPGFFEGVGEQGLKWFKDAGNEAGLRTATEVAQPEHVELCLKQNIDLLWIGARTTVDPFAVAAIADSLKGVDIPVMVKNPVNPDIDLWIGALERVSNAGIKKIAAIHRGFSTYRKATYRNPPLWRIPIELRRRVPLLPIICDPSHLAGSAELIQTVAQTAIDLQFDGLMIEVHPDPPSALSDRNQQLTPEQFDLLLKSLDWKNAHSSDLVFNQRLVACRNEIDQIDYKIIDLLATRMSVVEQIANLKKENHITTLQMSRFEEILKKRLEYGVGQSLSEDFLRQLIELIHEESLMHQEQCKIDDMNFISIS
jgi:chorismate mutase